MNVNEKNFRDLPKFAENISMDYANNESFYKEPTSQTHFSSLEVNIV